MSDTPDAVDGAAHQRLLVSIPAMGDENFDQTVVLVLEHDEHGALGLVLNRPTEDPVSLHLPQLADRVASPGSSSSADRSRWAACSRSVGHASAERGST